MARIYAFDFDGVLCDSVDELGLAGLKTCQRLLKLEAGSEERVRELLRGFAEARPSLETGWESVLMLWLLSRGTSAQDLVAHFYPELRASSLKELGRTEAELKAEFNQTREQWIEAEVDDWLGAHRFYVSAVAAVQELTKRAAGDPTIQVYVITTKAKAFAIRLLARCGIHLDDDRVFGLGSGPKAEVLATLVKDHAAKSCFFLEDRLKTLVAVKQSGLDSQLVLADWGYNTEQQRETARTSGFEVISEAQLGDLLK